MSEVGTKHLVPGVAVRVQRTREATVTNAQGAFLLTASRTDTLLFQALGYQPYRLLMTGQPVAQLVVHIYLQRDSIHLREVTVTADHLDRVSVNRALRNLTRPAALLVEGPQRPDKPTFLFAIDSLPPPPPPFGGGTLGFVYAKVSRAGKERRKMAQLKAQKAQRQAPQRVVNDNQAFKNNRGYE